MVEKNLKPGRMTMVANTVVLANSEIRPWITNLVIKVLYLK